MSREYDPQNRTRQVEKSTAELTTAWPYSYKKGKKIIFAQSALSRVDVYSVNRRVVLRHLIPKYQST